MNALFMIGIPIAGVLGGPMSGWIMNSLNGTHGWSGWQWLFLLEAIPSLVLGGVTLFYLPNSIRASTWLSEEEKPMLEQNIARDGGGKADHSALAALSLGTAGLLATMPVFWTYPSAILSGAAAAAGIAMINSVGNLAGFVSPSIIGFMKDVTHSTNAGMYVVSGALFLGAVLALLQPKELVNK